MSMFSIFEIAGSGIAAQSVRLNVTASNLANADMVAGSPDEVYRARQPVFSTWMDSLSPDPSAAGVRVNGITTSDVAPQKTYQPGHPSADQDGFVYGSNVDTVEEMVNMMSASRSYQNNIEILNTTKELLLRTINMGR
ncbi:MAG: flagellar basal body rod protein FlgC [Gammaproteobacteria bacterium]|nr:flagellar basal body rod protein FlgC [Gammaproteobacteria bacterium]NNF61194.1 flagellar basal body rod protein FlgC [Gammaproteobacteria bacterium]NNM19943.1 flagellar basal body rod protein FlgC [Gammaproteobacteria bacterium]